MDRVALYAAPPPESALWRFGSAVLGYDAASGREVGFPSDLPVPPEVWRADTVEPRRYGFHATLKAPFRLRAGATLDEVGALARSFAAERAPVRLPCLAVRLIGSFVALVPDEASPELDRLAFACVEAFEELRAPLTEGERVRRLRAPLSTRQTAYLERYGYPYVHEEFRFHMTLTGPLPRERAEPVRAWLAERYEAMAEPGLTIDALCLFGQETREAPFRLLERCPMGGRSARRAPRPCG